MSRSSRCRTLLPSTPPDPPLPSPCALSPGRSPRYARALDADPSNVELTLQLADLIAKHTDPSPGGKRAEPVYKKALALNRHSPATLSHYASFLAANKQRDKAEVLFKQALQKAPKDADVRARFEKFQAGGAGGAGGAGRSASLGDRRKSGGH